MLYVMLGFSLLGGIDKLLNNRFGLGVKFDEGFKAMGSLALTIIGIYSLSPVIARGILPLLGPLASWMNVDPSVFVSSILATDLGAFTTSVEIARDPAIGVFNGAILASTLGATISFTVPVAINLITEDDFQYFAKGILAGIVTVPLGMVVSGLMMDIGIVRIIWNLLPVGVFSMMIAYGLIKSQERTMFLFRWLGKIILGVSTFGLILGILDYSLGIVLIEGLISLQEGAMLVLSISIVLSGAYPMLFFLSRRLHRVLRLVTEKYDIDDFSILGLFSSLASCLPMLGVYHEMNWKGKILNAAFAVSGAYVFGGQLGYVTSVAPQSVNAFIIGKLAAGITSIFVALYLIRMEIKGEGIKIEY
ncbi:ethanolamine utilization protein EutH [Gudongella sp. SC589]|uniref:ethanolamine utilization protein EutH n=1 Tax=Gudongella sp. SC589 TaxID=3385990 RepID=UPI003904A8F8